MADAKKPAPKGAPKGGGGKPSGGSKGGASEKPPVAMEMEIVFFLLIGLAVLFFLLPTLGNTFGIHLNWTATTWSTFVFALQRFYVHALDTLTFLSVFIVFLLVLGIIYVKFKLYTVTKGYELNAQKEEEEREMRQHPGRPITHIASGMPQHLPGVSYSPQVEVPAPEVDPRWVQIQENMRSSNSSNWRTAILEADIILYEMLDRIGYAGDSIGEKLKNADRNAFRTLDDAWRAHKVRNSIAHEGASYQLSKSEAENTIGLYRKVFEEFYFI